MSKVNHRILVSRNEREGRYAGRCTDYFIKSTNIRKGGRSIYAVKHKAPSSSWAFTVIVHRGF